MEKINLQDKTKSKPGKGEIYWFENENIGLKRILFHRFYIPLNSFETGLESEKELLETEIVIDWLNLDLKDPLNIDGLNLSTTPDNNTETSIYLGSAHNPCDIISLEIKKKDGNKYNFKGKLFVEFEYEGVAENEEFNFETEVELDTIIKE